MSDTVFRIIGPHSNRLLTVIDAEKLLPGQVSRRTGRILMAHGWFVYQGPGKDDHGWLVAGSDPNRHPKALYS